MQPAKTLQLLGDELAILWEDGVEHYLPGEYLREESPSAENKGETDIFGVRYGGGGARRFPGVTVTGWKFIGNYAVAFSFSDGHNTGIYSWDYLRDIAEAYKPAA